MKKWIIVSLLTCFATLNSWSQVLVTSDVKYAIDKALEHSTTIKNNNIVIEKSKSATKEVWNKYIPTVSATGMYAYANSQLTLDLPTVNLPIVNTQLFSGDQQFNNEGNIFHAGVTAKAVLFSGGQIYNGAKALTYKEEGEAWVMQNENDNVVRNILCAFDQLSLIKQAEMLVEQSEERLNKEHLRVTKAVENGLAVPFDRDKITLATLELETQRKDLANKKHLVLLKLAHDTGLPIDSIAIMQHEVNPIFVNNAISVEDKNEIKALTAFKKANEYAIKKEKGTYLPTVGAFASYSYTSLFNASSSTYLPGLQRNLDLNINNMTIHPNFMAGVILKWDIFSGFERSHKVHAAKLSYQQIDNKLSETKELLTLQLEKNKTIYENATDQLAIVQQRSTIANNNIITADKQYKAGLISITDRLAAENDVYKQNLNQIESIIKQRAAALDTYQSTQSLISLLITK